MKSVTEFANVNLKQGLQAKDAFEKEGKTPEEVQTSLGEKLKMEGDKLKHFWHALTVAVAHPENLKRVLVVALGEGEREPAKATKVEEHHYVPDFHVDPKRAQPVKDDGKGGRGGNRGGQRGGGKGGAGPKESPWGLSEEQKKEKKLAQAAAAAAKKAPASN